jgi:hypothetical protein
MRMEPVLKEPQSDTASIATSILARNLAEQGTLTDSAIQRFLSDTDASTPTPAMTGQVPTLTEYHGEQTSEVMRLKTVRHIEIAIYMLTHRELSTKEIADRFSVTPATICRILATDGFQFILAEEAKKLSTSYKGMRSKLEHSMQSGATLAMDRLLERIQTCHDTDQLLAIVAKLAELTGMGSKSQPTININQFGVNGDHLRFATQRPVETIDQAPSALSIAVS